MNELLLDLSAVVLASSHAMTHGKRACQSSEGRVMWFQVLTVSVGLVYQSGVAMATVTINQYRMTAALAAGKA